MRIARIIQVAPMLASMLLAAAASAQVERSGGGASAQLYQDYQQAMAERTQLQADNAKLKKDLADAQAQLTATKMQLAAAKAGATRDHSTLAALAAAQAAQASTQKTLDTFRTQTQALVERFRQTIVTLKDIEGDRGQLRGQLAQSKEDFKRCAQANDDLYKVDNEVLDRYVHQGAFSYMARAEPFTRIERTRIANAVLEYRQRAEELRVTNPESTPNHSVDTATTPQPQH